MTNWFSKICFLFCHQMSIQISHYFRQNGHPFRINTLYILLLEPSMLCHWHIKHTLWSIYNPRKGLIKRSNAFKKLRFSIFSLKHLSFRAWCSSPAAMSTGEGEKEESGRGAGWGGSLCSQNCIHHFSAGGLRSHTELYIQTTMNPLKN